ncbi:hypothetical protein [Maridesulfovibrio sp.]|uniref:hypothetical protein n=1 Tax=Maridesulfovibrio sp. TaxID=2795000 RepID=UPI0029CA2019|nr:hypothetical protein [Maridesulfovibrio sp.]
MMLVINSNVQFKGEFCWNKTGLAPGYTTRPLFEFSVPEVMRLVLKLKPLRLYEECTYHTMMAHFSFESLALVYKGQFVGLALGHRLPYDIDSFYLAQFGVLEEHRKFKVTIPFFMSLVNSIGDIRSLILTIKEDHPKRKRMVRTIENLLGVKHELVATIPMSFEYDRGQDFKYKFDLIRKM